MYLDNKCYYLINKIVIFNYIFIYSFISFQEINILILFLKDFKIIQNYGSYYSFYTSYNNLANLNKPNINYEILDRKM